ncbi:MAG: hypothetical protein JW849_06195 [Phycisphaerae bacterium]|nr:hypothetical protein [Phycisphaerae bacterium]
MNRKTLLVFAWLAMAILQAVPAEAQLSPDPMMKMQKAVAYPHAGITLAIPTGFTISQQLWGEFQVMVAMRTEGKQAMQSISLAAYPVDEKTSPEQLLEKLRRPLTESLSVCRLKVVKTVPVPVVGLQGQAVHMTYTFRGIKTVALSACFIRDISPAGETSPAGKRLAYVLTLEVARDYRSTLLKTFEAIVRTTMLTPVVRPIDAPIDFEGAYLRNFPQGYAIRLPVGWVGGQNDLGVFMEQADFTLGGQACPAVQIVSSQVDSSLTAEACGEKAVEYMRKQGATVEILSQGAAKLAGRDGFQIVLRKTESPATQPAQTQPAAPTTTLEVHRLLCVPPNEEEYEEFTRNYVIIVVGQDVTVEQLTNLTEKLAEQFRLVPVREE